MVPEELIPPLSRIGVSPIGVTNGSLHATRHQLHNCTHFEREDDRSSQATNVRGSPKFDLHHMFDVIYLWYRQYLVSIHLKYMLSVDVVIIHF